MTPATDQWDQLQLLFEQAAALAPGQREEFIRNACGSNHALQQRIQRMFETEQRQGVLDAPVHPAAALGEVAHPTLVGKQIDRYKLVRLIASGGMGTVYEAQQDHPRRMVALKLMHRSSVSRSSLQRFEAEANILGQLRHSAIAQIHDAGVFHSDDGPQPFLAIEFIDGLTITEHADKHQLGT
jgi:hypothetical protein